MSALKQAKVEMVIEEAKRVMLHNGIHSLTIAQIATLLGIGEATMYRYFGSKQHLVICVAESIWLDLYSKLIELESKKTGYEGIEQFFRYFSTVYEKMPSVFQFVDQFDSMVMNLNVSKEDLHELDQILYRFKAVYSEFFAQGRLDHTIKESIDPDVFYYTTTHMIIGLCKQLSSNYPILESDEFIPALTQINQGIDMCLQYIKKESKE